jgi:lipopolysaccharide transport system ATP-binding protein
MTSSFIKLKNCSVTGIDTSSRAKDLRNFVLGKGGLISPKISILKNINLEINEGERVGLLGRNGSGKSSILKVICGIYPIDSGKLSIQGAVFPIIETGVGFDFEMTGRQNIKNALVYNYSLEYYSQKIEDEIISFSELGNKIDLPMKIYSSGMISRLAFSVSIIQDSDILVIDEVFATGDSYFTEKSQSKMSEKISNSKICIMVSHDISMMEKFCNRGILVNSGEIEFDGSVEECVAKYKNELSS